MPSKWGDHSTGGGGPRRYSSLSDAKRNGRTYLSKASAEGGRYVRKAVAAGLWRASTNEDDESSRPHRPAAWSAQRILRSRKRDGGKEASVRSTAGPQAGEPEGSPIHPTSKKGERGGRESPRKTVKTALRSARNKARLAAARSSAVRRSAEAADRFGKAQVSKAIAGKAAAAAAAIAPVALPLSLSALLIVLIVAAAVGVASMTNTARLTGDEATVAAYLLDKGLDPVHVAAIMGNMEAESGIDPTAKEVGGGGRGLCQWTGGRFSQLCAYAASRSKDWTDIHLQLDFLWAELTGDGPAASYASGQYDHDGFVAKTDLEDCVLYFGRNFERPNEHYAQWGRRLDSARKYLSALSGGGSAEGVAGSALSKIGCPYVWGAAGPDSFDCSGLVVWSYAQNGVLGMGRTTYDQISQCRIIDESEAQPGDLIFMMFSSPGVPSHVGIYIGGGQMVHAPTFGAQVRVDAAGWVYPDAVYARYIGS